MKIVMKKATHMDVFPAPPTNKPISSHAKALTKREAQGGCGGRIGRGSTKLGLVFKPANGILHWCNFQG